MFLPNFSIERKLWKSGKNHIAGIDEVGRGSWAGPLVAAAVILPRNFKVPHLFADSKKVKPSLRKIFADLILKNALSFQISKIEPTKIDKIGLSQSIQMVFANCVKNLSIAPDHILIDAIYIKNLNRNRQTAIIKGDEKSVTIAAASIIAKVYRDNLMEKISYKYPLYHFEKHKGYGTKLHQQAIRNNGFTKIHRTSYNLNYLIS